MVHPYVAAALLAAEYVRDGDGSTIAILPLVPELTTRGATFPACRQALRQAVETRIVAGVAAGEQFPVLYGVAAPTSLAEIAST